MKLVIGLVGEQGSGKGTFSQVLREVAKRERVSLSHRKFSDVFPSHPEVDKIF